MKQFRIILKFELKNYLKNKVFVGVTLFLVLVLAVVMFFPRITAAIDKIGNNTPESGEGTVEPGESPDTAGDLPVMLISADKDTEMLVYAAFSEAFPDYAVRTTADDLDTIKAQITSGDVDCAFVFEDITSYVYYVDNLSMFDGNTYIADEVLSSVYQMAAMIESGISADAAASILSIQIEGRTESLGKDQMMNFFYTYIMIFALYLVILLYGQMVATNVATEKSSRAMEVLITSAKPTAMMFGKVISSCIAGALQLFCVFGSAFLFFNLNKAYWGDMQIINSIFDMPLDLLLYMLLFFVLGFVIYAFMFGAVGSTASKLEDINTSVMPVTLLFVVGFVIVMTTMSSDNVDSLLLKVCSFIPFTSPMAMFTRIVMSTVPPYEIVISVALLIASVIGVGVLSARIYRAGVLLYGTPPKIGTILKMMFGKDHAKR